MNVAAAAFAASLRRVLDRPEFGRRGCGSHAEFKDGRHDRAGGWNRADVAGAAARCRLTAHTAMRRLSYAPLGLAHRAGRARLTARQVLERTVQAPRFGSAFRLLAEAIRLDRPAC